MLRERAEQDFVEIVSRNALWKLLDKYDGVFWDISYEISQTRGGNKKIFKLIRQD